MAIDEEIILFRWHLLQYQEADERFTDYRELLKESNEEVKINKNIEPGSIAGYAHMLSGKKDKK